MNQIQAQVQRARRRLLLQRFGYTASWTLFAALLVAIVALAVPKIWTLPFNADLWGVLWVAGSVVVGLTSAAIWTFVTRPSLEATAAEVDRRFGLRERLSSSLTMTPDEYQSHAGRALLADAETRASRIDVGQQFRLKPARLGLLPLMPLAMAAILIFIPDATRTSQADARASTANREEVRQVQTAAQQLKRKLQQQRRQAEAQGLKEAEELFQKLETDLDKITKKDSLDRKDAMIALNDLKKQLEERREKLGTPDQMRKALSNLNDIESGPADRAAKAMEKGDFGDAQKQIKQLADKLRDGKLSEQEKEQLKQQIDQLQKKVQEAIAKHEQAKQDLQQQIEQARREGRLNDAAEMQQKLNQMQAQDQKMQQMQQLAEAMGKASQAMQDGKAGEASEALESIADQLGEMQAELEELENLDASLGELSQAKDQMRCQQCQGMGCSTCQGFGNGENGIPGQGMGRGTGQGDRPEEENETNTYDTQVRGQPKAGRGIIAGFADGPNRKGVTREELQDAVLNTLTEESDPLENQSLPRTEREHAQQYFDQLRDGT